MRQILTLGVGQFGNNVTTRFYQKLSQQHQISRSDGLPSTSSVAETGILNVHFNQQQPTTHSSPAAFAARAILLDMDPDSIDSARASSIGRLLMQQNLNQRRKPSNGNWATGMYTDGSDLVAQTMQCVRREIEKMESSPECMIINHAIEGGTGGGVASNLVTKMCEEQPAVLMASNTLFGSKDWEFGVTGVYNSVLSVHRLVENCYITNMFDNQAISKKLNLRVAITGRESRGTYSELNNCIADFVSGFTAPVRFYSDLATNPRKLATNIIPFPRLHFLTTNYTEAQPSATAYDVMKPTFYDHQIMHSSKIAQQRFLAGAVLYLGSWSTYQAEECLSKIKRSKRVPFVQWIADSLNASVTRTPWRAATSILNSCACYPTFQYLSQQFTAMFRRKAFLHSYLAQGMDEMEFTEAQSNFNDLCSEYQPYDNHFQDQAWQWEGEQVE